MNVGDLMLLSEEYGPFKVTHLLTVMSNAFPRLRGGKANRTEEPHRIVQCGERRGSVPEALLRRVSVTDYNGDDAHDYLIYEFLGGRLSVKEFCAKRCRQDHFT